MPEWLHAAAVIFLIVCGACAAAIVVDIFLLKYRQHMWTMEAVLFLKISREKEGGSWQIKMTGDIKGVAIVG